jgi:hypothetical protein
MLASLTLFARTFKQSIFIVPTTKQQERSRQKEEIFSFFSFFSFFSCFLLFFSVLALAASQETATTADAGCSLDALPELLKCTDVALECVKGKTSAAAICPCYG